MLPKKSTLPKIDCVKNSTATATLEFNNYNNHTRRRNMSIIYVSCTVSIDLGIDNFSLEINIHRTDNFYRLKIVITLPFLALHGNLLPVKIIKLPTFFVCNASPIKFIKYSHDGNMMICRRDIDHFNWLNVTKSDHIIHMINIFHLLMSLKLIV